MVDVSKNIITIDTSVNGSAERADSAFFSSASSCASSNSLTDDCHVVGPVLKNHHSFAKLFTHAGHGKKSSPVHEPEDASRASTPENKDHPSTSKLGHKSMMGGLIRQKSNMGSFFDKEDCDLVKKYGVCDKGWIGKGATATIRLCHKSDKSGREKLYAVKEFRHRRKDESEKEYVKKLTSEFCISSSLHHINIVETVDLVKDDKGGWVTVMEYVPSDLYTVIKSGGMTSVEANCCFKQLVHGVAYMHSMGVAHRDLKPENLLLNEHGQLKIADFGVSDVFRVSWEKRAHMSSGLCGSEPYIAPEEFESPEYDAQMVDIWSMGIVYFCMAFEGTPFRIAQSSDPNFCRYLEARDTRSFSTFKKMAKPCRNLMYRILDPNPKKRITIAEILENDWFKSIEICSDCQAASGEHIHVPSSYLGASAKSRH